MQTLRNKVDKIMTKQVSMGPPKPVSDLHCHSHTHQIMLLARATDTILTYATPRASMQISRNYKKNNKFHWKYRQKWKTHFFKNFKEFIRERMSQRRKCSPVDRQRDYRPLWSEAMPSCQWQNQWKTNVRKHWIAKTCFPLGVQHVFASRVPNAWTHFVS